MQKDIGGIRGSVQALIAGVACLIGMLFIACSLAQGQSYIYNTGNFPVGNSPSEVISADFNGDGVPDLAVTNQADNTVSILLGKSTGGFATHVDYATANNPVALLAADFNGDGKPDLAVVNLNCTTTTCTTPSSVSILIGNGDGTFEPHVDYQVGNGATGFISGIVAVDFNGDKKTDLAVLDNAENSITVLLGNGDGTFEPQNLVAVGTTPTSLGSGDFNGDGRPDLITSNVGSGTVTVLLSKGDGTFSRVDSPSGVFPPQNSSAVAVGDFNSDGKVDAVVSSLDGQYSLYLLAGNGDGTFQSPAGIPLVLVGVSSMFAADLNRDGKLDLGANGTGTFAVLLGNGDGTFQQPPQAAFGDFVTSVVAADVNGDGQLDLAGTDSVLNAVDILLGNGNGTFAALTNLAMPLSPDAAVAADFNGDSKLDLAVAEQGSPDGQISVELGNSDGTFQGPLSSPLSTSTLNNNGLMVSGDFDGDGKADLAIVDAYLAGFEVLIGKGDGTFQAPVDTMFPAGSQFQDFAAGDFNSDGKTDIAVIANGPNNPSLTIYLSNGDGTFRTGALYPVNLYSRVMATDLNHDGKMDLVVTDSGPLEVYLGNGDGTFKNPIVGPSAIFTAAPVAADFNGDGKIDLAVGTHSGVAFLAGNGDGTFQPPVYSNPTLIFGDQPFIASDVNGDGKLDLVSTSPTGPVVMLGNGDGTFRDPLPYGVPGTFPILVAGDFNSDGIGDLAIPNNTYSGSVSVATLYLSSPTPNLSSTSLTFGGQDVGSPSPPQPFTLTNAGNAPMTFTNLATTGDYSQTNTCDGTFKIAANCQINVTFTPAQPGTRAGSVVIIDNAFTSPQTVPLSGTGLAPVGGVTPSSLIFANQGVGTSSKAQTVTLSNTGTAPLNISSVSISANFTQTNNCGNSVAVNANCTIQVTFSPATAGKLQGTLMVTDNNNGVDNSAQTVALTGTGLGAEVKLSPSSLSFSSELVGASSTTQKVRVTNPGNEALSFKSIAASGDFGQTNTCGTSVAANGSCTISVTFTPTAGGTRSGILTLTDNATGKPQTVSLTGTGQDFSFAPPAGGTASVSPGQPASYTLSLAGLGGLNQSVAFTCTGAPSESRCSVSPSTLTPGSSATSVTVAVTTTAASLVTPLLRIATPPAGGTSQGPKGLWWLMVAGLMGLMAWRLRVPGKPMATVNRFLIDRGLVLSRKAHGQEGGVRGCRLALAGLALLVLMALGMAGCGGGGGTGPAPNPGTPAGTYTLMVTATANTTPKPLTHNVTLTLKVQ